MTMLAALALLGSGGAALYSQTAVAVPAQTQAGTPTAMDDPTRPEVQPRLDIDRDPIPSPDAEVNPTVRAATPSSATMPSASSSANQSTSGTAGLEKQKNGMYVLHANVDEVLLNCAVIDAKGQPVMGLNRDDFHVWEDGVAETVNSVQHLDLPVSMGILIDDSGSMRDKRAAVNSAAAQLLSASNPQDEAFVVNFSDHAYLDQGFTTDRVALDRGMSRLDSAGTTAMYDAVAASADELAKHGKDRKQVLLIITDGADNASRLSLQEAIRRVEGLGGPVVYTIGLLFNNEPGESQRARDALEMLSQQTGGVAYFPRSLQDVNSIAAEVARDIREQYVVDYHSSKPFSLGGYRSVRVEATSPGHGQTNVRTKRGYYAKAGQEAKPTQDAEQ